MALLLCSVGSLGSLGCTLLSKTTIAQCETTADCAARGGEFAQTICAEDKFCRVPTPSETGCTTNRACSVEIGGLPAICPTPGGACQPLLSDDCTVVYGDYENDDAIPIGVVVPLTGVFQASGVLHANVVELALEELAVKAIGLPGVGAERRPIIGVVCDEASNPTRAATFLAEDVGVPAVIGPIASDNVLDVATSVTIDAGVLLVAPQAGAPGLRQLGDNGLVWHTIGSIEAAIRAQSEHLQDYVEPSVRSRLGLTMSDSIRLMVIAQTETTPGASADAAQGTLVFNGELAVNNGANFLRRNYSGTDTAAAVADAIAFQPHIVVPYGFNEVYDMLPQIDEALTEKPHYLMTTVAYLHPLLTTFIATDAADRAMRVTGVTDLLLNGTVGNTFSVAYRAKYGEDPISASGFTYDAAYAVIYALAAAGHVPELTGEAAAIGMTKLVSGQSVDIGSEGLDDALGILPNGGSIDVEGATGPLNFDTATGDVRPIVRIFCINAAVEHVITEQSYDDATGTLSGVFSCP